MQPNLLIPLGDGVLTTHRRNTRARQKTLLADWSPEGELAVVRTDNAKSWLEFPFGTVLYETTERVGGMRVSPDGRVVAFAERAAGYGGQWTASVIDRTGNKTVLADDWPGEATALAWSPDGKEIWYETGSAGDNVLKAVSMDGSRREVGRFLAQFRLLDVAPDGRVLVRRNRWRVGIGGVPPGQSQERDFSWLDASEINDISPDGTTLLITEYGEGGNLDSWSVFLRKTNGEPAVLLGEGMALALSPDGSKALTMRRGRSPQLVVLPTGPGQTLALPTGGIRDFSGATWMPDGERIVFSGSAGSEPPRCYIQDLAAGAPRPITPPGTRFLLGMAPVSPDGRWIVVGSGTPWSGVGGSSSGGLTVYPLDGGEARPVAGEPGDLVIRWDADNRTIFVSRRVHDLGLTRVLRIDTVTGDEEVFKELSLNDPAGLLSLYSVQIADDLRSYYYSYARNLSDLYLIEG